MKRHALIAQRIEAHGGQIVRCGDLELVHGAVLQLAGRLAEHVYQYERQDVRAEHLEHPIRLYRLGAHLVDDKAHHIGVAVAKQGHECERGNHQRRKQALVLARYLPIVMKGSTG